MTLIQGPISGKFADFPKKNAESFQLVWLIEPLFKSYSKFILTSISLILCIGTLILFVGGVARLILSLNISSVFSKQLSNKVPIASINFLSLIYIFILSLVYFNYLTLDKLVSFADGFFIANAIIGLITAIILFDKGFLKYCAILLTILFCAILFFSNIFILIIIFILFYFLIIKNNIYNNE